MEFLESGVYPQKNRIYGRHPYCYSIKFANASGKERRVHEGGFRSEQAARRAMEAELAAIAAGKYDEPPDPPDPPDPQLTLDDELARRGLSRRDAPDPQADEP